MNILRLRGTRLLTVRREFTNTEMGRAEKKLRDVGGELQVSIRTHFYKHTQV